MSEQKTSFMQELDLWSDANVVGPLLSADPNQQNWQTVVEQVKKTIRTKVLESYRNGAGELPQRPESRPAAIQTAEVAAFQGRARGSRASGALDRFIPNPYASGSPTAFHS